MRIQPCHQEIFRIKREGLMFFDPPCEAFFYKGDQYWEVHCKWGNFALICFNLREPQRVDTQHIPIDEFLKLKEWARDIRLLMNPFRKNEELFDGSVENEKWLNSCLR